MLGLIINIGHRKTIIWNLQLVDVSLLLYSLEFHIHRSQLKFSLMQNLLKIFARSSYSKRQRDAFKISRPSFSCGRSFNYWQDLWLNAPHPVFTATKLLNCNILLSTQLIEFWFFHNMQYNKRLGSHWIFHLRNFVRCANGSRFGGGWYCQYWILPWLPRTID